MVGLSGTSTAKKMAGLLVEIKPLGIAPGLEASSLSGQTM